MASARDSGESARAERADLLQVVAPPPSILAPWVLAESLSRGLLDRRTVPAGVLTIMLILGALSLGFIGTRTLWVPDEGRYSEIPREMLESGDFVTPREDYARFLEKPPLWYWITALSMRLFGHAEWACRLPVALAGLGTVLVVIALAWRMATPRAGLLAGMILGLSPLHYIVSQILVLDTGFTFFLSVALALALLEDTAPRPTWRAYASAAALAMATLIKGPLALVLLALVMVPLRLLSERPLAGLSGRWWPCAALYLGVTLPWFLAAEAANPGFFKLYFVLEHVDRFLADASRHPAPFHYFLPIVLAGFFPWSFAVPILACASTTRQRWPGPAVFAALWLGIPCAAALASHVPVLAIPYRLAVLAWCGSILALGAASPDRRPVVRFAALWACAPLLMLAFSVSKLPTYVLYAWPGLALSVALALDPLLDAPPEGAKRVLGATLGVAAVMLAAGLAIIGWRGHAPLPPDVMPFLGAIRLALVAAIALLTLAARLAWQGRWHLAVVSLFATGVALALVVQTAGPRVEAAKDVKVLCDAIRVHRHWAEPVILYAPIQAANGLPYYLEERVWVAGFIHSELDAAHDWGEPACTSPFMEFRQVVAHLDPTASLSFFVAREEDFRTLSRKPWAHPVPLCTRGPLVLFTNRPLRDAF